MVYRFPAKRRKVKSQFMAGVNDNIGAVMIRIGYWGMLYYTHHEEHLKIV